MVGAFGLPLVTLSSQVLATTIVHFNDGGTHDIDYAICNTVYVDYLVDVYDKMAEAIKAGQPYQAIFDPPPADPSVAHPAKG